MPGTSPTQAESYKRPVSGMAGKAGRAIRSVASLLVRSIPRHHLSAAVGSSIITAAPV